MTTIRPSWLVRAVLAGVAVAVASAVTAAPAMATPATGGVGIMPGDETNYFHVTLAPGQHTDRPAVVHNSTADPVDVLIYPVDATNTPQGGFALGGQNDVPTGIGAWTHLAVSQLHLAPYASTTVRVPITVPEGTAPGDYAGGVVVQRVQPGTANTVQNGVSVQLNIIERVGARIYLKVSGEQQAVLDAGPLEWHRDGDAVVFTAVVTNAGNVRLRPTAAVKVTGFGLPDTVVSMSHVEELLPGASVTMTGRLSGGPLVAVGQAVLTVQDGVGHTVTRTTAINLVSEQVSFASGSVALLVVFLSVWLLFSRRRRYKPRRLRQGTARLARHA